VSPISGLEAHLKAQAVHRGHGGAIRIFAREMAGDQA
jgi:hypothetical protein